jgi:hypothetical protein
MFDIPGGVTEDKPQRYCRDLGKIWHSAANYR